MPIRMDCELNTVDLGHDCVLVANVDTNQTIARILRDTECACYRVKLDLNYWAEDIIGMFNWVENIGFLDKSGAEYALLAACIEHEAHGYGS